ncbi:flagellin [Sphingomonas sp. 4RDLI-65]|uniref:flagellin N-terminal helical domain-containing protein n=1 Tax=Sphingomonas sp. 4RDLI-65 TaxID=3111641 RepID=UPI003C1A5E01
MTVIGTNTSAMRATNASTQASSMLSTSMERLSTGKRINSAKDDAAGLAIASSMTSQIRGMNQGIRNANDGISLAQTAEGALDEVSNNLQRMRELTVQSQNDTYSVDDRANIDKERVALAKQIASVVNNTEFNGTKLFNGDSSAVVIQAGATDLDQITLSVGNLTDVTDGTDPTPDGAGFALSNIVDVTATDATVLKTTGTLEQYDDAIASIATTRAGLGADQNRLQSAVNNLTSNATNLSDAKSRIEDTDFSAETTALAKAQILSQASTAMLSQANQSQQSVLKLLQ